MSEANYRLGYPDTKHKQLPDGSWVPVVSSDGPVITSSEPAASATASDPINVAATSAVVAPANAARLSLRIRNAGNADMAIGPANITWANRVIVLAPGDVWIEEDAPGIAWSAVCAPGTTSSATVQEVLK